MTAIMSSSSADEMVETTTSSSSSPYSVLSEKVNRALAVRTDTPAMKAALDALSHLDAIQTTRSSSTDTTSSDLIPSTSGGSSIVDTKNVRVAIEQDALQQALYLQDALRDIVQSVQDVRRSISDIKNLTQKLRTAAYQTVPVIGLHANKMMDHSNNESNDETTTTAHNYNPDHVVADNSSNENLNDNIGRDNNNDADEHKLATVIMNAFYQRDQCRKRLYAINEFLDKFDLNERDNYLLENYNFMDRMNHLQQMAGNNDMINQENNDGIAFLKALERVRMIRYELQKQTLFFQDGTNGGGNAGGLLFEKARLTNDSNTNNTSSATAAAVRMMENLADKQERAYERLYHWLQKTLQLHPKGYNANTSMDESANKMNTMDSKNDDEYYYYDQDELFMNDYFIKLCLYTLQNVPAFYCHILELIASSRRLNVTKSFLIALTVGDTNMQQQPIEMKSHDSLAYVGDMLAFSFRAFSVEADVAKGLLEFTPDDVAESENPAADDTPARNEEEERSTKDDEDDDLSPMDDDYTSSYEKALGPREMLSISMSGIARPLKSRIIQVITTLSRRPGAGSDLKSKVENNDTEDDDEYIGDDEFGEESLRLRSEIVNLYDICGLLLFYISVMGKCIEKLQNDNERKKLPPQRRHYAKRVNEPTTNSIDVIQNNTLVASLLECLIEGTTAYEATVRVYGAMLDQWSVLSGESESALIHSILVRIADARMNSPGYSSDVSMEELLPPQSTNVMTASSCRTILSIEWITETLIESCLTSKLNHVDDIMYMKQSLESSKKAGLSIASYEKLRADVINKENILINELVIQESATVLELCGLGAISSSYLAYREEQRYNQDTKKLMISYPGLSQLVVETSIKEFYMSLYSPPLPTLEENIKDPITRRIVRTKISDYVSQLYADMYHSIISGGYKDANRFLEYQPEQVKTLLSA